MASACCHFIWSYIFISYLDWREYGAAISLNITYFSTLIVTEFMVRRSKPCRSTLAIFNKSAFSDWSPYFKIAVPGAAMMCFEWWAFELLAIFSGLMGTN